MLPELLFFKDLDSFELTPEYLEMVYLKKPFRFNYPLKSNKRKYWVQSFPNSQITISDMMLQTVDTTEVWQDAFLVDLSVDFEDVAQLGEMASKLKNIGGYKQVRPNPKIKDDEEFSSDEDEGSDEMDLNSYIGMGPKIVFRDVATPFIVNATHFEFTYNGEQHRFIHGALNPPQGRRVVQQQLTRRVTIRRGLGRLPAGAGAHMLIPGVMLQKQILGVWTNGAIMDVYIVFAGDIDGIASGADLGRGLRLQGYVDLS